MSEQLPETGRPDISHVTRAVVVSQMLFSAGHSLTSGGFLYYFVSEFDRFRDSVTLLAIIQIAPETFESFSFLTREILCWIPSRKWLWAGCLVIGRVCSLLIPLSLLWTSNTGSPIIAILVGIAIWHLFQGVSYCSYISWLSDLVPGINWGRFFAKRKIASLAITMTVPVLAGVVRDRYLKDPALSHDWQRLSYAGLFGFGTMLVLLSLLPMLQIPDVAQRRGRQPEPLSSQFKSPSGNSFYWLLASRWE